MRTGLVLAFFFLASACSPKVYVIDRQSVLEDEAAGEWPDFEKKLLKDSEEKSPTPSATIKNSESHDRLYRVLNGDVSDPVVK